MMMIMPPGLLSGPRRSGNAENRTQLDLEQGLPVRYDELYVVH